MFGFFRKVRDLTIDGLLAVCLGTMICILVGIAAKFALIPVAFVCGDAVADAIVDPLTRVSPMTGVVCLAVFVARRFGGEGGPVARYLRRRGHTAS